MQYYQRVSRTHGRSGQLHWEMAEKLEMYVFIHLHLGGFVTD